jgi:hypothetical protein
MMNKATVGAIVVVLVVIMLAGPAFGGLKLGLRQYSFHNMPLPNEQTMGAFFGLSSGGSVDIVFGLDYWKYKLTLTPPSEDENSSEVEVSGGTTQLHGGVKFYLNPPEEKEVVPYILGEIFYGIGSASISAGDYEVDSGELVDPIKDLLSPYGFVGAFGGEYFISETFAVGGEVGVRYSITKIEGDASVLDNIDLGSLMKTTAATASDSEAKFTSMSIYTGICLTFMF